MNRTRNTPFLRRAAPLLLLWGAAGAPALRAALPEYSQLLTQGRAAYDRKAYLQAIRDLRLACFGMLDEPKALADCLARLALAQDKANDAEGFQQTFQRLLEVEERFTAYSQGDLPADLRTSLEPRIVARVPAATLEGSAGFRFLAAKKADRVAAPRGKPAAKAPPPGEPAKSPAQPPAAPPPPPTREAAKPKPSAAPAASSVPSPGKPPQAVAAPPAGSAVSGSATGSLSPLASGVGSPPPLTDTERDRVQQARERLATEQTARELKSIFDTVKEIADAHPDSRETQHVVGQAAYRLSRWAEAVTYFKRGGDPGDDQAELLFYIAVSLFESGDANGATAALKRALPNLRRTPYVDKYAQKILGQ